jgi:hypothetical protein
MIFSSEDPFTKVLLSESGFITALIKSLLAMVLDTVIPLSALLHIQGLRDAVFQTSAHFHELYVFVADNPTTSSSSKTLSAIIAAGQNFLQAWCRDFAFTEFHAQTMLKTAFHSVRALKIFYSSFVIHELAKESSPIIILHILYDSLVCRLY